MYLLPLACRKLTIVTSVEYMKDTALIEKVIFAGKREDMLQVRGEAE